MQLVNVEVYKICNEAYSQEIINFIEKEAVNSLIFHLPNFFYYHPASKFPRDKYVKTDYIFTYKNKIFAMIVGVRYENTYESLLGASYGGIIHSAEINYALIDNLLEKWLLALKEENVHKIYITVVPEVMYKNDKGYAVNYIHHVLQAKKFQIQKMDMILCHKINKQVSIESRIDSKTHTELKQAFKNNLRCEIMEGVCPDTYKLLSESQQNFGKNPTHTYEELLTLHRLFAGKINSFKIYSNDELLSGIITFTYNKKVLNTFYIFDKPEGRKKKANHLAYYNVIEYAKNNDFDFVDFGPSTNGYEANLNLIKFKENWDSVPDLRVKYVLKL
ncbi:MAG: hypothetical protein RMJ97_01225 [Raineya sp.]|nr:GNAT family N-acetyltransferase [Raineya sp.]MDW8295479.1 hypothetical protein [Raineya sp.]